MDNVELLKELHDIHLPQAIGLWPLAWGWWVLILLVLFIFFLVYHYRFFIFNWRQKKQLMNELISLENQYTQTKNTRKSLDELAFFLKKAALCFYPREQVGGLFGEEWLTFLSATAKNLDTSSCKELFMDSLYQAHVEADISKGFKMAKKWLSAQRLSCMN